MNDRILDTGYVGSEAAMQAGLQKYFTRIYGLVGLSLLLTGSISYFVAQDIIAKALIGETSMFTALVAGPLGTMVRFAPLVLLFVINFSVNRMSARGLAFLLFAIAVSFGLSLSSIFFMYPADGIIRTGLVTGGSFVALSAYGMLTKRDLSGLGKILFIGLVGIVLASLAQFLLPLLGQNFSNVPGKGLVTSPGFNFAVSLIGVVVFGGLIMYDTQRLKNMYYALASSETNFMGKAIVLGALSLYLDIINLFLFLLNFLGGRD